MDSRRTILKIASGALVLAPLSMVGSALSSVAAQTKARIAAVLSGPLGDLSFLD
jgi:hypothetical protein